MTGPIAETLAFRLDGVWAKRDGFLRDTANDTDINNRDRYFVRGQLLFEPTDALSIRLIADYTYRDERCCGAIYIDRSVNPQIGDLNNPAPEPPPCGPPSGGRFPLPLSDVQGHSRYRLAAPLTQLPRFLCTSLPWTQWPTHVSGTRHWAESRVQ